MKYAFSTKIYDNARAVIGGIIEVEDSATNSQQSFFRYDLYIDVFDTFEEAEEARQEALEDA